jgi:hypothetical protein
VTVVGTDQSATTDANGDYTVGDVPAGTYTVTATKTGYEYGMVQSVVVVTDTTTIGISFALAPVDIATAVSVTSVSYATEGGKNNDKHLLITVALVDDLVDGASVSIDLYRDGSLVGSRA